MGHTVATEPQPEASDSLLIPGLVMCTVLVCQVSYVDRLHERKESTKAVGSDKQALLERHVKRLCV